MIHYCVCSIILVHLCSRSVVCTVCAVVVGTYASQFRDVLGISTETTASLEQARQEHFFVCFFTSSACKQRINIFCQPHFGMVGLVHSQTESLRRARSCLPVISILVKKNALLSWCQYPQTNSNSMQHYEYFTNSFSDQESLKDWIGKAKG